MDLFFVFPIALALAMDAFAVSVGLSVRPVGLKFSQRFRLAVFFGFFQFMMPLVGWLAGRGFIDHIRSMDHWVASGLLFIVGGKMLVESFRDQERTKKMPDDPTRGLTLVVLSVATSIDAFAVGLSFAALRQNVLVPSVIIGAVAFLMTFAGTKLGDVNHQARGAASLFLCSHRQ